MGICETNQAQVSGRILSPPALSHAIYGEEFYTAQLEVRRLSGNADVLPVLISGRKMQDIDLKLGGEVLLRGQLRSYNKIIEGASRLELKLFVREAEAYARGEDLNQISLVGYLCKPPVYRVTPFGREIADLLLAVNRSYNKSDYIPTIVWGKNARLASHMCVGQKLRIEGRIQSRQYEKQLPDGTCVQKTAYEVSACTMCPESL